MFMKRSNARELDVNKKSESSSESDSDWYLNYDYEEK